MRLITLSVEDLNAVAGEQTLQRAESYVGNFYDCNISNDTLTGKIRGNHGEYNVSLTYNEHSEIISHKCMCERAKTTCCKHAAALGLTYIYTPWLFHGKRISRSEIKSIEDLQYYLATMPLKDVFSGLKDEGILLSDLALILKISVSQLSAIVKDDQAGKVHQLTEPIKIATLYMIEKKFKKIN